VWWEEYWTFTDYNEVLRLEDVYVGMNTCPKRDNKYVTTGSGRNIWRFYKTAVSGTVGVGNLSFSALLARLKAFQLPWSAGLYSIGLSLWRRISKTTVLSLWLSGYFVGTSTFIGTTVSLVAILYCCGWETAEKQRLPQKGKPAGREPSLNAPENTERVRQGFVRSPSLAGMCWQQGTPPHRHYIQEVNIVINLLAPELFFF